MENFAVKSESFALYEAFKKDVENIGWKYNEAFTQFTKEDAAETNCLFFANDWDGKPFACSFSLSNSDDAKSFRLETQYGEALAFAKKVWEQENKPKFKVGEWVRDITDGKAHRVLSISDFNGRTSYEVIPHFTIIEDILEKWIPKKGEYISVIFDFEKPIRRYVCIVKEGLGQKFTPYAGLDAADKLIIGETFGYFYGDIASPATPSEIALLDSKLAEQGKRFDKERCELVDIPKHKEPIIGELAIGWNGDDKERAMMGILRRSDSSKLPYFIGGYWFRHAILFESPEQFKAFLKS